MAKRKRDDVAIQDATLNGESFMDQKKTADRDDAKGAKLTTGLTTAKELVASMAKAVAHGVVSDDRAMQAAILHELADLAEQVRDGSRKAVRDSMSENRNLQR